MGDLKVRRRQVLAGLGAAGATLAMPAILRAQPRQIVMATGGGKLEEAYRKTVYEPFTARTGVEVITTANEAARLKAMVEQNNVEWDVLQYPPEELAVFARDGLLDTIEYDNIDVSRMAPGTMHEHFVMTDFAAYHVAWNTDNIPSNPPTDWSQLFAIDGRFGLWKRAYQTLEAALLADGVPTDQLYPLDVDRAFAALEKVKSKIVWWERGAQGAQLLIDGEVDAGAIWNGRVFEPKQSGAPVDFVLENAVLVSDGWCIPKGAGNKELALELIAIHLSAEAQAEFAKLVTYGPVNQDALPLIDEETRAVLPSLDKKGSVILDVQYWAENAPAIIERFNSFVLS